MSWKRGPALRLGCLSLLLVGLASTAQTSAQPELQDPHILLPLLDRIEAKLDELNATVSRLASCSCLSPRGQAGPSASPDEIQMNLRDPEEPDQDEQPRKRETKEETLASRDLFGFNRLASNLNSIPSSSGQQRQSAEELKAVDGQHQDQQLTQVSADADQRLVASEKRLLLALGQLQESMFGDAFDSMNLILKQQLTSFKTSLIKMSNRLMDHNYQHHVLANQMSLMRDECSLAIVSHQSANSFATCGPNSTTPSGGNSSFSSPNTNAQQDEQHTTLRSSDVVFVRMLSEGLEQSLQRSLARHQQPPPAAAAVSCPQAADLVEEPEARHLRHESFLGKELKQFQRRMDEIDSVVKQSALLLNKFVANRDDRPARTYVTHTQGDSHEASGQAPPASTTTLTFTNSPEPPSTGNSSGASPRASRWFAGSKVPNQRQGSSVNYAEQQQQQQRNSNQQTQQRAQRCQPKTTSLVKPRDCRQLREAGANCSGQYYIFAHSNSIRHVLCDMNQDLADEGGGWTLIMRRIDKSLASFSRADSLPESPTSLGGKPNSMASLKSRWLEEIQSSQVDFAGQDWSSYRAGFGALEHWSEFFIGLDLVHQLAGVPPAERQAAAELQVDLVANNSQELHLRFENFSVASEAGQFELRVGQCNATAPELCSPIARLNGTRFFTHDRLANCTGASQGKPQAGWWLPVDVNGTCPSGDAGDARLFAGPIGKSASYLHWPGWPAGDPAGEPLRQVVLKVRQQRRQRAA
ncbi:tenascin-R isoform X2 [Olea europaea subsp. europaea]|uniref:Tenascin-R isoform X2 n=1 Tax=Olea europaea subsp. europaea TaxID=158383 RepID=A0A8S0RDW6_OLEEU|nr:tenascin-R isoform X2 [Olea europaea subsp. europaea]